MHLVCRSILADDAEMAIREALTRSAPHLRSVPGGETGERRNWHAVTAVGDDLYVR